MKFLTIIGARPQFIKAAALSCSVRDFAGVEEVLVHTGQHFDDIMSDVFFREMGIPRPRYRLDAGGLSHGAMTGRMLEQIEKIVIEEKPQGVLVYGDTNSTLAGALAAKKILVPVAHVESGLRSYNQAMPEEINRVVTDHISDILFVPTVNAARNLEKEGLSAQKIVCTGDIMLDAVRLFEAKAEEAAQPDSVWRSQAGNYVLVTIHRAENTDNEERLSSIFGALAQLGETATVYVALHPRTAGKLEKAVWWPELREKLTVLPPLGYLEMLLAQRNSRLIVTDSGGVQKEAFFLKVPCATLRDETEWIELTEGGWNKLIPPRSRNFLVDKLREALTNRPVFPDRSDLFGDGNASRVILRTLTERWS